MDRWLEPESIPEPALGQPGLAANQAHHRRPRNLTPLVGREVNEPNVTADLPAITAVAGPVMTDALEAFGLKNFPDLVEGQI